jgi:AAA domain, putative AbiEii toxin, Type IV TA system
MTRLQSFQVEGYKNLRAAVRLDDLGRFNVLHGDNSVGKSNLLESIGLFFVAVEAVREEAERGPSLEERYARHAPVVEAAPDGRPPREAVRSFAWFMREGYPPGDVFDRRDAQPIVMEARLELDHDESDPPWLAQPVVARVRVERGDEEVTVRILGLVRTVDGADLATGGGHTEATDEAFALVLSRLGQRARGKAVAPRFALIRADRTLAREAAESPSPLATREPLPRTLGKALYDAERATDTRRARFRRFTTALDRLHDLVGPGRWRMDFDIEADQAELVLDDGSDRLPVPLRLMGSGIQQIATLCAGLMVTEADIVAIEEPELNLRWTAQRALRDVLHEIVAGADGLSQLLLASHSGQFEEEPTFYLLTRGPDGPHLHKKPAEEARLFTQPEAPPSPSGTHAPLGYLTSEGVVEVPPAVRENLGLTHGGGVLFVRGTDGHYRMLTNDQYADLFEDREPPP